MFPNGSHGLFSFSKSERILKSEDYASVRLSGVSSYTEHFRVIYMPNDLGITRLGITVSKKIGNAVKRNRIKRILREFFRLNKSCFPYGCDTVIVARKDASHLSYYMILDELLRVKFDVCNKK